MSQDPEKDQSPGAEPTPPGDTSEARRGETSSKPREIGGRKGPDPTRYGDWEKNGRCIDF
jgi:hypothetical protein